MLGYHRKQKYNESIQQSQSKSASVCVKALFMASIIIMLVYFWNMQLKNQINEQIQHKKLFAEDHTQFKNQSIQNQQDDKSVSSKEHSGMENHQYRKYDHFYFDPPIRWQDKTQFHQQSTSNLQRIQHFQHFYPKTPSQANNENQAIKNHNKQIQAKIIQKQTQNPSTRPMSPIPIIPSLPITPSSKALTAASNPNVSNKQKIAFAKKLQALKNLSVSSDLAKQQRNYYQDKYKISNYQEQPFCIVIPSFNNAAQERYKHNLNSILQQQYSNYHIVFIDDASNDGTAEKVQQYAQDHQISEEKLKIIINPERKMAMPNIFRAAFQFCKPYQIFIIVDGDDQLIGKQVFKFFNSQFRSKQYWLMYSNFVSVRGTFGYSRPYSKATIDANKFRSTGFMISHLRAFYTKLLTLVKQKDLKDQDGNWYKAANDVAMYTPILQMVHTRFAYVPQICYLYNSNTGLNNHRVRLREQKSNHKKIRAKERYDELKQLFTQTEKSEFQKSLGNKIQIKNMKLPEPKKQIKKEGWEL